MTPLLPRRSPALLCGLVLALTAAACTDESAEPPPPPDTSDAQIVDGLADLWAGDNPTAEDRRAARCFAHAFADRTTSDQLRQTGLIDDSGAVVTAVPVLDPELAGVWVDAQFTCVDFVEESTRALSTQSHGSLDEDAYAVCLEQRLRPAQIRAALVAGLSGDADGAALEVVSRAQLVCSRQATS